MQYSRYATNPILPGFYPDPSICRVEDDYYLVTSSFAFFPGVPIFHSRDLRHWEQIGHVLTRSSQLPLNCRRISGGIYAPTLRYHDGVFYMITTNVDGIGDFVCTATDPRGPWSEMHVIENAPGIDPSLFFDEDGICYMCGNEWGKGEPWIWAAEFDTKTFSLKGERKRLWQGALRNAWAPEAPHLYFRDGYYYLMIAEGGTEFFHAVTIARSKSIFGPYEGFRGNPILTHRHLGKGYPISNTGHADLVENRDGSWHMVLLASRPYGGYHLNMGRETFMVPVVWEDGWPVVNPGVGHVDWLCPVPDLEDWIPPQQDEDAFTSPVWNHLGCPQGLDPVTIGENTLRIRCIAPPLVPEGEESEIVKAHALGFLGRRQQHMSFEARVKVSVPPEEGVSCGLVVLQNDFASLRIELTRRESGVEARAVQVWKDGRNGPLEEAVLGLSAAMETEELVIRASGQSFALMLGDWTVATAEGGFMGSESCGGFVGAYIGLFASGNGEDRECEAVFTDFHYTGIR